MIYRRISLKNFRDKYKISVFKKFFLNQKEYKFFESKIETYNNNLHPKDIYPKYKLKDILDLLFFEITNGHIDILFYTYHIYCIIRFKFFGQLPFYDRKISNDLKISKKFYTFRL